MGLQELNNCGPNFENKSFCGRQFYFHLQRRLFKSSVNYIYDFVFTLNTIYNKIMLAGRSFTRHGPQFAHT